MPGIVSSDEETESPRKHRGLESESSSSSDELYLSSDDENTLNSLVGTSNLSKEKKTTQKDSPPQKVVKKKVEQTEPTEENEHPPSKTKEHDPESELVKVLFTKVYKFPVGETETDVPIIFCLYEKDKKTPIFENDPRKEKDGVTIPCMTVSDIRTLFDISDVKSGNVKNLKEVQTAKVGGKRYIFPVSVIDKVLTEYKLENHIKKAEDKKKVTQYEDTMAKLLKLKGKDDAFFIANTTDSKAPKKRAKPAKPKESTTEKATETQSTKQKTSDHHKTNGDSQVTLKKMKTETHNGENEVSDFISSSLKVKKWFSDDERDSLNKMCKKLIDKQI